MSDTTNVLAIANGVCHPHFSTEWTGSTSHLSVRLNFKVTGSAGGYNSWVAAQNDLNQYVIIGGDTLKQFIGVSTQGRSDCQQFVKTYKVTYTIDGQNWLDHGNYTGNVDNSNIVQNIFKTPIIARSIKISPLTWEGHISMRCDANVRFI